jgi:membrane-associated phospholipid phosphatase
MKSVLFLVSATILMLLAGCGTMSNGKKWGRDATFTPGWDRVGKAAYSALASPLTWGPAVGAAVLQVGDWDRNLAKWASDKTPVFGSQRNADKWSDYLLYTSGALYGATALITPSGATKEEWVVDKMKGFSVGGAALLLTEGSAELLNVAIKRKRPDGEDYQSFPSAHASIATSCATLSAKNIEAMNISKSYEIVSDIGLGVIAAGSSWARVEAKKHYASDVLAGMALGHFLTAFVNDAFLNEHGSIVPNIDISRSGFHLAVSWNQ